MSELLDKQVNVQIEILKVIFRRSRKPTKKCAMKIKVRKKRRPHKFCLWWKEEFIKLHQKSGRTDFDEFRDTIFTLNEGTNSLVTSELESNGWFIVCIGIK